MRNASKYDGHTPFPWRVEIGKLANEGRIFVECENNGAWKTWVCEVKGVGYGDDESQLRARKADATLIADAPELLKENERLHAQLALARGVAIWLRDLTRNPAPSCLSIQACADILQCL